MIKEANKKIKVSFKRPKNLAKDNSSTYDVVKHAVNWLDKNENWKADIVVILPPTSPLRKAKHIDDVVDLLIKSNSQAAMTIVEPSYPPYWMFKKVKMKYQFILPEGINIQRRQDTPKVYQPSGMVWALKYDFLLCSKGVNNRVTNSSANSYKEVDFNIDNELGDVYADFEIKKSVVEDKPLIKNFPFRTIDFFNNA